MEDPWGSPWASTDTPPDNESLPSSQADVFLSPPPKAFFSNATSLSAQPTWSRNDSDDSLGIWAATDRADGTDNQSDWGVWAETGAQLPRLSPSLNASGRKSPLPRRESAAASSVLTPKSRSRTPSVFRNRSPDPWAAESSTKKLNIDLPKPLYLSANDTPTAETRSVEEAFRLSETIAKSDTKEGLINQIPSVERNTSNGATAIGGRESLKTVRDLDDKHDSINSNPGLGIRQLPSPPSSTFTLDSRDGPEWQDSPITSIDEDRGGRPHNKSQGISEKVQGLVDIYGGITKLASKESPTLGSLEIPRAQSRERSSGTSDTEYRGIAGEDASVDGDIVAGPSSGTRSSELSSTPKAELKDAFTRQWKHQDVGDHGTVTETPPVQSRNIVNKFTGTTFDTNLALVDELFPGLTDSLGDDAMGAWDVPSGHISDSFTTISERKAWYRISRYGSMRKHNSGDDENYHRVLWPTSQLHSDVIKITRRWMEEDLYAGKAIFGGTKRTGFFDWDSDAAPVELNEVFRRRKSVTKHTRTTSTPVSNEMTNRPFLDERPYRNSTGITLSAKLPSTDSSITPIPSFGSNQEPKLSQISPATQPPKYISQRPTPTPESDLAPVLPHQPIPVQTTSTDDEDDWGEMVSSPHTRKHIQSSISAHTLYETPTENEGPAFRSSSALPDTATSVGLKPSIPIIAQPSSSDTRPSSDMPVLEKLKEETGLPIGHISQPPAYFTTLEDTPPRSSDFSPKRNRGSIGGLQTPDRNIMACEAPDSNTLPTTALTVGTATAASPANLPRSESKDNLIVQNILRNIPDMSYMLR
ncbi:hypothetical protein F4861DRAFT_546607 [Xylaria intraflava]|nr:hypothetical protein F4861DRAFT_546607 [Xylaria intraflava]